MYRKLIDPALDGDASEYAQKLIRKGIKKDLIALKMNLHPKDSSLVIQPYQQYLDKIIKKYTQIITLHPIEFALYAQNEFNMLSTSDLKKIFIGPRGGEMKFHELVVENMQYEDSAKPLMAFYMKKNNFTTCVYCNAQKLDVVRRRGKYEQAGSIDHFFDKAKYPFLCTSFFNLYPCCSDCNSPKRKGSKNICFYPYRDPKQNCNPDPFLFTMIWKNKRKIGNVNIIEDDVDIKFKDRKEWMGCEKKYGKQKQKTSYDKLFEITLTYQQRKNLILSALNSSLFKSIWQARTAGPVSNNRLSSYTKEELAKDILRIDSVKHEDIHKEPNRKLLLDLGVDLGLI